MAKRRLLSDDLWARHLEPPTDEREIARHYTLGGEDLAQVVAKRGDANRLGYALVLLYLRFPGRVLEAGETPPDAVLVNVARQLGVPTSAFGAYAHRAATRRAHLGEIMRASGHLTFDRAAAHAAVAFLTAAAQTIIRPGQLAGILVEELWSAPKSGPPGLAPISALLHGFVKTRKTPEKERKLAITLMKDVHRHGNE